MYITNCFNLSFKTINFLNKYKREKNKQTFFFFKVLTDQTIYFI
jgi:hypothetical protein